MKKENNISNRVYVVYFGVLLFACLVVYKIFAIQIGGDGEYQKLASTISEVTIKASRGNIFADDKEKSALAISVPIYDLRFDTKVLHKDSFALKVDSFAYYLASVFKDKSQNTYKRDLLNAQAKGNRYYLLQKKVSYSQLQKLKQAPIFRKKSNHGGRIITAYNKREKPFKSLARRTVGYVNEDGNGVGLEDAYQDILEGTNGLQYMKKVGGGDRIPLTEEYIIEPQNGKDIYTTIDINLQDVAEKALMTQLVSQNAQHGCAILMEVKTGKIKAIANISKDKRGKYREIYNHAIGTLSEPGSTFKLASIMVALEDNVIDLNEMVDTRDGTIKYYDRIMRDSKIGGHGVIPLWKAFALSSNVGISFVINENYKKKQSKFLKGIKRLGLGEKAGIEIKGERQPYVKTTRDSTWSGITIPWMSIGYETSFTPLQILTFYNAVANNGIMVKPQFVTEIKDGSKVVEKFETVVLNKSICSKKTIKNAQFLLEKVVEEGTATNLKNLNFKIAGKTGTTQVGYGKSDNAGNSNVRHQASFCGYFPADNPKYSCIVVVAAPNKSIYGNIVSGTVFKEIAEKVFATDIEMARNNEILRKGNMPASKNGFTSELASVFNYLKVPTTYNKDNKWSNTYAEKTKVKLKNKKITETPNTVGMGLKDAVFLLENKGFIVKVNGNGTVKNQQVIVGRNKKTMILTLG